MPVELGEISAELINLENNDLTYENLSWLEGLPIRKSLKSLNLAENKVCSMEEFLSRNVFKYFQRANDMIFYRLTDSPLRL